MKINYDKIRPNCFVLIIGNARSGTTLVGSIVDAHPRAICANETIASIRFWRDLTRHDVLAEIVHNSLKNYESGRSWQGYEYKIETKQKVISQVKVIGDKVWNPSLLLMHGDRGLIGRLSENMGCEVAMIHCVRNPFDAISTMASRSAAGVTDRIKWYSMHCEAADALIKRKENRILTVRLESLISDTQNYISQIFEFLGEPDVDGEVLSAIQDRIFSLPKITRHNVVWTRDQIRDVDNLIRKFDFLHGYSYSDDLKDELSWFASNR